MKQLKGAMALWGILSCLFVSYGQQETLIKRINCGGNQVSGDDGFVNEADTTATEIAAKGIALGAMDKLLLEKVEELTLHIIAQERRIQELEQAAQE
ncbi:MAG: hypothetical protein AAGB24_15000 [Bacteroidota bacterium]